jgi:hypothetical protein
MRTPIPSYSSELKNYCPPRITDCDLYVENHPNTGSLCQESQRQRRFPEQTINAAVIARGDAFTSLGIGFYKPQQWGCP